MINIIEEIEQAVRGISNRDAELLLDRIQEAERVFLAGSGRTGLMVRSFAMRLMQTGLTCYVVGETTTPAIQKDDLLIIGSGSGETSGLLSMAKKARELNARVALVTVVPDSSIGAHADTVVTIPATIAKVHTGRSVPTLQPRGSLFEQCLLIFFETLVVMLMKRMSFKPDAIMERHANLE
jgi:6-phospho-3-hexuloisomerase